MPRFLHKSGGFPSCILGPVFLGLILWLLRRSDGSSARDDDLGSRLDEPNPAKT